MHATTRLLGTTAIILGLLGSNAANAEKPTIAKTPVSTQPTPKEINFGCGLIFNSNGNVSTLHPSGHANMCLQCRADQFGNPLAFSFYDSLSKSVSAHGVSPKDAAALQAYTERELLKTAAQANSSTKCEEAFSSDSRVASHRFENGACKVTAVDLVNNSKSPGLVTAFLSLYEDRSSQYCSICAGDRSCVRAGKLNRRTLGWLWAWKFRWWVPVYKPYVFVDCPKPSGRARRSVKKDSEEKSLKESKCPSGLAACPISSATSLTPSDAYECLDVTQEINSCGGCVTLGQGIDCSTLKGVKSSGCSAGKCNIFSCKKGYSLSKASKTCVKKGETVATPPSKP